jgi:hypothetical protein
MPVQVTALVCEGERGAGLMERLVGGGEIYREIPGPHTNSSGLILASLQICFTIFGCKILPV